MTGPEGSPQHRAGGDFSLDGKVAFITGASRGIGRSIAIAFARAGAYVIAGARTPGTLDELATAIRSDNGKVLAVPLDVTDSGSVERAVEAAHLAAGGLDIVVNNAGSVPYFGPSEEMTDADWDRTFDVNLRSMFVVTRHCAPLLFASGGGSVVNISSIDALVGMPRMTAYSAAKAGVVGLTKALAVEWAERGVRVNCVCPGAVATDMTALVRGRPEADFHRHLMDHTPQRRFGTPEEVANAVLYLASDAASFTTGAILNVDGGFCSA